MPKRITPLSEFTLRTAKPKEKEYKRRSLPSGYSIGLQTVALQIPFYDGVYHKRTKSPIHAKPRPLLEDTKVNGGAGKERIPNAVYKMGFTMKFVTEQGLTIPDVG